MIKRIALLVVIFTLSLAAPTLAAEPDGGVIEGQVVNGTEGGSSVSDQEVALQTYLNDAAVDSATTTRTDTEGRFIFNGLATGPGNSYQVKLNYQQVDYVSDRLSFDDNETRKSTEVTVYDATTSDEAITVTMSHTVVYIEEGSLQVQEYFLFANMSDRTYIGSREVVPGVRETLRFSLPDKATGLQPGFGLMECCVYDSEDGFVHAMPVLPGSEEIVYSYRIDYDSEKYLYSRKVNYPTLNYEFLVQAAGGEVISDQLVVKGPVDINGIQFNHFSGVDFTLGSTIETQLTGLPSAGNKGIILWVTVALGVLVGVVGFSYLVKKKRLQPVRTEVVSDRQKLLVELAQLDDEFESGKIDEEVYRRLRAKKKSQLVVLVQKKNSGNG